MCLCVANVVIASPIAASAICCSGGFGRESYHVIAQRSLAASRRSTLYARSNCSTLARLPERVVGIPADSRYAALVGLGCVLFLWATLAAIALAVAATGAAIFLGSAGRRSKFGMVSGGLIGAAGVVVVVAVAFVAGWLFWRPSCVRASGRTRSRTLAAHAIAGG
jgi:hypothetical protein